MSDKAHCPLCGARNYREFATDARRNYLRCARCFLVWVPPRYYLDRAQERSEYDKHQNTTDDPGYRRFLDRLCQPLLAVLDENASGLEFGCGPGPALACMLREAGHQVTLYDSFYYPDSDALAASYDFISATEVVEHLHNPGVELDRLWAMLRDGGVLAVMTKLVLDEAAFSRWHYKNDPTHVVFFSEPTWQWWAQQKSARLALYGADVILFHKGS
ncbi:MAG: class I SAM-dependent methyltransferase [Halieaceae bacterium]